MNLLKPIRTLFGIAMAFSCCATTSEAVIVAGTQGTGNNNNTQAGLDGFLLAASAPAFPFWNNLIRVTDASGVYLGTNDLTGRGWVITANHVTTPTTMTVAGNVYTVQSGTQVGSADLKLYEIGGGISDPALPNLPTIPLAPGYATPGSFVLMFGRGSTNSTTAPYPWVAPGTSNANGTRWGTNLVAGYFAGTNPVMVTTFTSSLNPSVTPYEAQAALGDSGGGAFIYANGSWHLTGIAYSVGSPVAPTNPSEIGDETYFSDVYSKLDFIQGTTGLASPIPEPSVVMLCVAALGLAGSRRSRPTGPVGVTARRARHP